MTLQTLLEPLEINHMTLKNRIMFPPMTTGYEARDGSITEQSINFYKRVAEGGASYIVLGDVTPVHTISPTPKLVNDDQIPSFKALADALHEFGCKLGRGGLFIDEAVELAKLLEADGVDTFHVGQANHTGNLNDTIPAMGTRPECFMAPYARRVKEAVSVPVSTVGRIMTPEDGYEYKRVITPAGTPRKIAVVGGGLVGAETAEYIAQGDCEVTIVEMMGQIAAEE